MAIQANIHEAKTKFSQLLEKAHAGEEVIIAKAGKPYARIVPVRQPKSREPGAFRGRISGDILGPITDDELSIGDEPSAPSRHPRAALVDDGRPAAFGQGAGAIGSSRPGAGQCCECLGDRH